MNVLKLQAKLIQLEFKLEMFFKEFLFPTVPVLLA